MKQNVNMKPIKRTAVIAVIAVVAFTALCSGVLFLRKHTVVFGSSYQDHYYYNLDGCRTEQDVVRKYGEFDIVFSESISQKTAGYKISAAEAGFRGSRYPAYYVITFYNGVIGKAVTREVRIQ